MFVWRGYGLAVVGVTFLVLLATELGVERVADDDQYYQVHGWPKLLGFVLAAVVVRALSNYLDGRPARVVIDKATGQEMTLSVKHDLFFVPLRYWPAILLCAGLAFMMWNQAA